MSVWKLPVNYVKTALKFECPKGNEVAYRLVFSKKTSPFSELENSKVRVPSFNMSQSENSGF